MDRPVDVHTVSVIIPAYDEEETISSVVRTAKRHRLVHEVIVVNDGSTDATERRARKAGARVITIRKNSGKGTAMSVGAKSARGDILVFLDADILGLNARLLTMLIKPVLSGTYEMYTLIRDRKVELFQNISSSLVLGGERAVTREFWESVPDAERTEFDVELALNYYAQAQKRKTGTAQAPGLTQVVKEVKHGFLRGFLERLRMIRTCTKAYLRYFLF